MAGMFKTRRQQRFAQSSNSDKQTRLENHDTSEESVCGKMPPGTCNRSRGFSARWVNRFASVSGATVRAVVERRRTESVTTKMTVNTNHDYDSPCMASKKETCTNTFEHCSKLCSLFKAAFRSLSLREVRCI